MHFLYSYYLAFVGIKILYLNFIYQLLRRCINTFFVHLKKEALAQLVNQPAVNRTVIGQRLT